jgi:SNF2 family DNA or RNA helicase
MTFLGELRPYQQVASSLITDRGKALLALDLGTGKTIVSIAAIEELREQGKVKCALLIMSSSLTKQWEQRIEQFTDSSAIVVDGSISPKKRSIICEQILSDPPDYIIMGLRQVVSDLPFIRKINPDLVLVDEVTSIKNFGTQQTKAIKKLKSTYRIGLTAEPVENGKAEELFSIMQWIDPEVLGDWREFEDNYIIRNSYNIITGYKNVPELNKQLMTACISKRRYDPDVAEFMPTVEEFNCYVEMDSGTKLIYDFIARDLLNELYNAGPSASKDLAGYYAGAKDYSSMVGLSGVTSRLLGLLLLLDDPTLLASSARAYEDPADPRGSKYAHSLWKAGRMPSEPFLGAKLEACLELATGYLEENPKHKVIIFARFRGMLPLLQQGLDKYDSVLFHGGLNGKQRGEAISAFTTDPDVRLFISSDAGGYGVDLYAASHLINYDLPLSSGTFKQRNGRHVRASSTFRHVYIDNLLVRSSIEEYQLTRLNYKARVSQGVLTGMSEADGRVTNDAETLTQFLKNYFGEQ